MRRFSFIALLIPLTVSSAAWPATEPLDEPPEEQAPELSFEEQEQLLFRVTVDRIVREQMEEWRVPGAVVAVIEEGRVLLLEGYGLADVESGQPVDPRRTVFHVASLAKPVTASALLQLADRDLLDLDVDVNRYLETLAVPATYPEPVTVGHLLTHAGGFDERIIDRKTRDPETMPTLGDYLRRRLPPRIRPPGLVSIYSNHGYALAGLVASDIVRAPFDRYVETAVFEPLGMTFSSYGPSPRTSAGRATGYGWGGLDGPAVPPDFIKTIPSSMLLTTAADMSRWMLAILGDGSLEGRRILEPASAKALTTRQFSNNVSIPGRSFGLSEGGRFDPPEWLHGGGTTGFTSALVLLPEKSAGVFVAFNSQSYIWETVNRILDRYETTGDTEDSDLPASPPMLDVDLERFVGYYREAGISTTTIEKLATLIEQERVAVTEDAYLLWRDRPYRAVGRLVFERVAGRDRLGFVEAGTEVRFLSYPGTVQEKVHWCESRPVQLGLWGLFVVTFLGAGAGWVGVSLPRQRPQLRVVPPAGSRRWPFRLASWASILNLAFLVALGVVLARSLEGGGELHYGVPRHLRAVLGIPLASGAISLPVALVAIWSWVRGYWSLGTRLKLSLVALALLAFVFHLHYWNLLGFRY